MRRSTAALGAALAAAALAAAGCGAGKHAAAPARTHSSPCLKSWHAGWQQLANRVGAPVYCPDWIPSPLTGDIHGQWSSGAQVGRDHSYLAGFIWVEHGDEVHVNLRGYPGRTAVPSCVDAEQVGKRVVRTTMPCFADPKWTRKIDGRAVTLYTVNRDADQWHLLFAWHRHGALYALSEHVAPPFGYRRVIANLERMYRNLVLVEPQA